MAGLAFAAPAAGYAAPPSVDAADPALIEEDARDARSEQRVREAAPVAATVAPSDAEFSRPVQVGAILIEGTTELPPSRFAHVIAPYAGRLLGANELQALSSKVADEARAAGYGLATAWIPQQKISNGVLRVVVDEGRIDAIDATGPAAAMVTPMLAVLANGRPVKTATLERQLLLAGDLPGVDIGRTRLSRDERGNVLVVETEQDRIEARAYADNWGTSTVGPVRTRFYSDFNGIAGPDQLSLSAIVTPFEPSEFGLIGAGYERQVGTRGTEIELRGYAATTTPGGVLEGRDIEGDSIEGELGISHPLLRSRARSLWIDGALRLSRVRQSREDVRTREDVLATISAGVSGFLRGDEYRLRGRVTATQGVDAFGATDPDDPLASRDDASGRFTKLELWLEYRRYFGKRFSLQLQSEAQVASRPLLSSEETGLGGRNFLRGYDYREYSGDKGIAGSAELRFDLEKLPKPVSDVQLYTYVDGGSVGNYHGGRGGGSLASAGGGARIWFGRTVELGLELGVPLSDSDFRSDKDPRFSFTLASYF